jgi:hypothetical protein
MSSELRVDEVNASSTRSYFLFIVTNEALFSRILFKKSGCMSSLCSNNGVLEGTSCSCGSLDDADSMQKCLKIGVAISPTFERRAGEHACRVVGCA